jgi:peptidoglycan hydrolase-like protein with peptidoglycan-binding domain
LAAPAAALLAAALLASCSSDAPKDDLADDPAASEQAQDGGKQSEFFDQADYDRQLELTKATPEGPEGKPWEQMLDPQSGGMVDTSEYAMKGGVEGAKLCFSNAGVFNPWRQVGLKQYQGGHDETWGGVTINIDRNWVDLGRGSTAGPAPEYCGGVRLSFRRYPTLRRDASGARVSALQCLLNGRGHDTGAIDGVMDESTGAAVRAFRARIGLGPGRAAGPRVWTALLAPGGDRTIKYGAAGERVRRLQRALNAASGERLRVNGVFADSLAAAVKRYQKEHRIAVSGVVTPRMWGMLRSGKV